MLSRACVPTGSTCTVRTCLIARLGSFYALEKEPFWVKCDYANGNMKR